MRGASAAAAAAADVVDPHAVGGREGEPFPVRRECDGGRGGLGRERRVRGREGLLGRRRRRRERVDGDDADGVRDASFFVFFFIIFRGRIEIIVSFEHLPVLRVYSARDETAIKKGAARNDKRRNLLPSFLFVSIDGFFSID